MGTLTVFFNLVLSGNVSEHITDTFYGPNICALNKDGGGIRPYSCREHPTMLSNSSRTESHCSRPWKSFQPNSSGFETKGGCKAALHAARQYMNRGATHRRMLLKSDVRIAFNCKRRDIFLRAAQVKAPSMYRLLWQAYHEPSNLNFNNNVKKSESGI